MYVLVVVGAFGARVVVVTLASVPAERYKTRYVRELVNAAISTRLPILS
mgnify:FL=1